MSDKQNSEESRPQAGVVQTRGKMGGNDATTDLKVAPYVNLLYNSGLNSQGVNQISVLEDKGPDTGKGPIVAYNAGNAVKILDLSSGQSQLLLALDDGGIGCFCVHPKKTHIAVGTKSLNVDTPARIYIYEYPSLKLVSVMSGGAEFGYAALNFYPASKECEFEKQLEPENDPLLNTVSSQDRNLLVSISTSPDYSITVWDWEKEELILKAKAFGQDVYSVDFSPYNKSTIVTSGAGHIRFWKMANTFTGLKLQGEIGKFGRFEISDIASFDFLPNGLVLTTSRNGNILVWEGNFVKCSVGRVVESELPPKEEQEETGTKGFFAQKDIWRASNRPAHEGGITLVHVERSINMVLTAGEDGILRFWHMRELEAVDTLLDGVTQPGLTPAFELPLRDFLASEAAAMLQCGVDELPPSAVQFLQRQFTVTGIRTTRSIYQPPSETSSPTSVLHARAEVAWLLQCSNGRLVEVVARANVHRGLSSIPGVAKVSLLESELNLTGTGEGEDKELESAEAEAPQVEGKESENAGEVAVEGKETEKSVAAQQMEAAAIQSDTTSMAVANAVPAIASDAKPTIFTSVEIAQFRTLFEAASGSVTQIEPSDVHPIAVRIHSDGSIDAWAHAIDDSNQFYSGLLATATFYAVQRASNTTESPYSVPIGVTCARWAPRSVDPNQLTLVLGFSDGSLRLLMLVPNDTYSPRELPSPLDSLHRCVESNFPYKWVLLQSLKPHTQAVELLTFSPCNTLLVTASNDGTTFMFNVSPKVGAKRLQLESVPASIRPTASVELFPLGYVVTGITPEQIPSTAPSTALVDTTTDPEANTTNSAATPLRPKPIPLSEGLRATAHTWLNASTPGSDSAGRAPQLLLGTECGVLIHVAIPSGQAKHAWPDTTTSYDLTTSGVIVQQRIHLQMEKITVQYVTETSSGGTKGTDKPTKEKKQVHVLEGANVGRITGVIAVPVAQTGKYVLYIAHAGEGGDLLYEFHDVDFHNLPRIAEKKPSIMESSNDESSGHGTSQEDMDYEASRDSMISVQPTVFRTALLPSFSYPVTRANNTATPAASNSASYVSKFAIHTLTFSPTEQISLLLATTSLGSLSIRVLLPESLHAACKQARDGGSLLPNHIPTLSIDALHLQVCDAFVETVTSLGVSSSNPNLLFLSKSSGISTVLQFHWHGNDTNFLQSNAYPQTKTAPTSLLQALLYDQVVVMPRGTSLTLLNERKRWFATVEVKPFVKPNASSTGMIGGAQMSHLPIQDKEQFLGDKMQFVPACAAVVVETYPTPTQIWNTTAVDVAATQWLLAALPMDPYLDPASYSIRDEKIRNDAQYRHELAMKAKNAMQKAVDSLRDEVVQFKERVKEANAKYPHLELNDEEVCIDREISDILKLRGLRALALVDLHHQYERQQNKMQLARLVGAQLGNLSCDRVTVHGLLNPLLKVATLREYKLHASDRSAMRKARESALLELKAYTERLQSNVEPVLVEGVPADSIPGMSLAVQEVQKYCEAEETDDTDSAPVDDSPLLLTSQLQDTQTLTGSYTFPQAPANSTQSNLSLSQSEYLGDRNVREIPVQQWSTTASSDKGSQYFNNENSHPGSTGSVSNPGHDGTGTKPHALEDPKNELFFTKTSTKITLKKRHSAAYTIKPHTISFEARKTLRLARKRALDTLISKKPEPGAFYHLDVAATEWAQRNVGDWVLKTHPNYSPPEDIKVDPGVRQRQILLLRGHLRALKQEFNAKLLGLMEQRAAVLACVAHCEGELREIELELSETGLLGSILHKARINPESLLPQKYATMSATFLNFKVPEDILVAAFKEAMHMELQLPGLAHLPAGLLEKAKLELAEEKKTRIFPDTYKSLVLLTQSFIQETQQEVAQQQWEAEKYSQPAPLVPEPPVQTDEDSTSQLELSVSFPAPPVVATEQALPVGLDERCQGGSTFHRAMYANATKLRVSTSAHAATDNHSLALSASLGLPQATAAASVAAPGTYLVGQGSQVLPHRAFTYPWVMAPDLHPYAHLLQFAPTQESGAFGWTYSASSLYSFPISKLGSAIVVSPPNTFPDTKEELVAAISRGICMSIKKTKLRLRQASLLYGFDKQIEELTRERLNVQYECSVGSIRLSSLEQELVLLQDMARKDAQLENRLFKARQEKESIAKSIASCTEVLTAKRAEITSLQTKEKALLVEFDEIVGGPQVPQYSSLLRIYKKKIRRQNATDDGNFDIDDLDNDDDYDFDDDDEEDEEEELAFLETVDKTLLERINALRQSRGDLESSISDLQRVSDDAKRNMERLQSRAKQADKELENAKLELSAFQREKQGRLNRIETVMVLKSSQVLATNPSSSPQMMPTISPSLNKHSAINTTVLHRLRRRALQLEKKRARLVNVFKSLKTEGQRLINECKATDKELDKYKEQVRALSVLKFGQEVDINGLDAAVEAANNTAAQFKSTHTRQAEESWDLQSLGSEYLPEHSLTEAHDHPSVLAVSGVVPLEHANLSDPSELQHALRQSQVQYTTALWELAQVSAEVAECEAEVAGAAPDPSAPAATALLSSFLPRNMDFSHAPELQKLTAQSVRQLRGKEYKPLTTTSALAGKSGNRLVFHDETAAAEQESGAKAELELKIIERSQRIAALRAELAVLKTKGGPVPDAVKLATIKGTGVTTPSTDLNLGPLLLTSSTVQYRPTGDPNPAPIGSNRPPAHLVPAVSYGGGVTLHIPNSKRAEHSSTRY